MNKTLTTYQGNILLRALGEKGLEELHNKYNSVSYRGAASTEPTSIQRKIATEYVAQTDSIRLIAVNNNVTQNEALAAIRRVAMYELRNRKK